MPDVSANRAEGDVDKVVQRRFFRNQNAGVFVDVGAANPDYLSVSALYRALGWRIIAIEPNPAFCAMHHKRGHEILQYACGERDEDGVDFCVVDSHGERYQNGQVSYESFFVACDQGVLCPHQAADGRRTDQGQAETPRYDPASARA
jgi:hypothetical protein